ncbi:hypothetical protein LQ944_02475 [Staphylococcus pasteuri]|uniref:hypothetical protein n=1 Tax=Staphylococcus pasteuri TaxID=45972 RepID=UPI001E4ABBD1|nr:hypothetical protein [Staphylococcus pasteuri]MCD9065986.1 hypothetical protein [Staphylococcus pasteuri]WAE41290.1 hypothetical protein LQ944_02475 [Staphylococcus pasteuri]
MSIKFDEKAVMKELEKKFNKTRMRKIYDEALIAAGKVILEAVKANIRYFRDTGAEYGEVKLSKPMWENGARSIRLYWEGEKHRYAIVHLNEKGFHNKSGKFIKPKGMGAIDKAIRSARNTFYKVIQEEVEKAL